MVVTKFSETESNSEIEDVVSAALAAPQTDRKKNEEE